MAVSLKKEFKFEAAHFLPKMPEGHKCRRLHGHSFRVEVHVKGKVNQETGILIDFADIKRHAKPLVQQLDHYLINEVGEELDEPLLINPTSENLAKWFYDKLKPVIGQLDAIVIHETCTASCLYRPDSE